MAEKKNIPEIRFKGFEGEWEVQKLGAIGDTYTGLAGKTKVDFGHGEGKYITYMNVFSNTVANPKMTEPVEIDKCQNQVKFGDVLFTTSSETPQEVGMSTIWVENTENVYLNSFCFGYRPNIKFDNNYLAYVLRSSSMRKKISFLAQGISRYNISKNRVMEIDISTPVEPEQTQIGTYFQNLDSLISLHQRKYDKLLNVKKAMLEKMFPKEGADVPEIRFKGFEGKWERRIMNTIFNKIRNAFVGIASPYYVSEGHFYLESNNVKDGKINRMTEIFINEEFYQKQKENWLKTGDIVMVQSGHVGHTAVITPELNNSPAHALIIFANKKEETDSYFLNYQFQTQLAKNKLSQITTGNTIKHILSSEMKEFLVMLPSFEEQTKIGTFFQNLDTLITQHQMQLEKLKNIKKACLEKMFV